jgi:hypothetical protein
MKRTIAALMLIPALATAEQMPLIVGTVPNRDNAKITFTTYQGDCKGNDRVVYTQADGGQVTLTGCYRIVGYNLFVVWSDGDIYTYPWVNLTLSREMDKFLRESR